MTVTPSPSVAADRQVDIADFASVLASEKAAMASSVEVTCIRQKPYPSRTGNDILVHLLVYKKDMNKFAKIEERIPAGFEAKSMESQDGLFTFKDGLAKFVWMNLPPAPGFKVSYRLIPDAGQSADVLSLDGTLSYIQDGRNIEVDIVEQDIDLSSVNEENVEAFIAALDRGEAPPPAKPEPVKTEVVKPPAEEKPVVTETRPKPPTPPVRTGSSRIPAGQLLPVYDGVYFRVQLAAMMKFQDANSSFAGYRLPRPVLVEQHRGMYKYTAGSFTTYSQAREFKNQAISRGIKGAFVVSYRNGNRIDIMDALQATGGK
jgi:hypothetical protein